MQQGLFVEPGFGDRRERQEDSSVLEGRRVEVLDCGDLQIDP